MNETVDEIHKGSYDLHVHAGPDPAQARRLDAMEAARHAYEAEMGGFVLKSHDYPTAPLTYALERMYPGLVVAGSLVLNRQVGGLNPHAVRTSARLGARIVWMPTYCARFYRSSRGERGGIGILDSRGELLPEVHAVLDVVVGSGLALASGHLSPSETLALFRAAADRGCERLIVTHPAGTATDDELRAMTRLGAFVEYTWLSCLPSGGGTDPAELAAAVRRLGVDHCIVTTDLGQWMNPPAAEGMRMAIAALLGQGLGPEDISTLVKSNPAHLLGLAP